MKNDFLVSVIVPIYNVSQYLDRCIESIVSQSYSKLEIILIDDGSTDSSGILADRWKEIDERIRVIHKENGGLSSARNTGIKISKGDFLIFVDSDDWIHKDMISTLINYANEADLVCCGMFVATDNTVDMMPWFKHEKVFSSAEAMDLLISNKILTSHIVRYLFPKKMLFDVQFPEGKIFEDIRTLHKIFFNIHDLLVIPKSFYYYYVRDNSISKSISLKNTLEWVCALNSRYKDLETNGLVKYREMIFSQIAVVISLAMVQNKYKTEEIYANLEEIKKIKVFLKSKKTKSSVKKFASKKQYIYFRIARFFGFYSNTIYSLFR